MRDDWRDCDRCKRYFEKHLETRATLIYLRSGPEAVEEHLDEVLGEYHEAGHRT